MPGFAITRHSPKHARLDLTLMAPRSLDRLTRMGCLYGHPLGFPRGFSVLGFHEVPRCYSGQATLSGGITACLHRRRYSGADTSSAWTGLDFLCVCLLILMTRSGCSPPVVVAAPLGLGYYFCPSASSLAHLYVCTNTMRFLRATPTRGLHGKGGGKPLAGDLVRIVSQ